MHPVLIVGAGFSGLGMAIRLKRAGIDDFVVLEQGDEVGGTWRDNDYPGCSCDVESRLYSYSFEPNPNWTRTFAPQAEILQYLVRCADKYGIRPHIRFRTSVLRARFDEDAAMWEVQTGDGQTLRARIVISACGPLSRPSSPDVPGLSAFRGKVFHSARWDHTFPVEGKRIAVIGTGASAIQIVPSIAPRVARLYVFQRTPPWIIPKPDRAFGSIERWLFRRFPALQGLVRRAIYWKREALALGFVVEPRIMKILGLVAMRYLRASVPDRALRAKVTPNYTMGCKRVLPTNDWFRTLQSPQVELVTDAISEVRAECVATCDGQERQLDAIVLATGFDAAEQKAPFDVRGRDGQDLNDAWRDGPEAYLGTSVSGFPNLFLLVGPNTGLGHNSMLFMIESQIAYVMSAIETMQRKNLRLIHVLPEVQRRYNARIQDRLKGTVWSSGCTSWYRMRRSGRNTTLWPGFTFEFRMRTRRFDVGSYETA